jgi:hypothetical protein
MLVSVSPSVYDQFVKTGRLTILGEQNIFQLNVQGDTTKEANERAKQLINNNHPG